MKQFRKLTAALLPALLALAAMALPAAASEGANFSVTPLYPDRQEQQNLGYFNLTVQPGETLELSVLVTNSGTEDITTFVEAVPASTNRNGIIHYEKDSVFDETLKINFSDITDVSSSEVTIPTGQTREVPFTIRVPAEPFEGAVMGAVRVLKKPNQSAEASGMANITNQFSYLIGVVLRESEGIIAPAFDMTNVKLESVNYKAAVVNYIRNPMPESFDKISVDAQIFAEGSSEPLLKDTKEDVRMAPNSVFEFTLVDQNTAAFAPGNYVSRVHLEREGQTWDFEVAFTVDAAVADAVNENTIVDTLPAAETAAEASSLPVWAIVLISVGGVLLLLVIILVLLTIMRINRENREFYAQQQQRLMMQQMQQRELMEKQQKLSMMNPS